MLVLRAGTQVLFRVEVRDVGQPETPLYTPVNGVKLTLFRPDSTKALNKVSMSIPSTGVFTYLHQTAAGDQEGDWKAEYEADDSVGIGITFPTRAFHLRA